MKWLLDTLASSIGKKLMMALTGFCFCLFLAVHLAGNLTLFGGREMFNSYAAHLHALGVLLLVGEWVLLLFALVHIVTGLTLFYQNIKARPNRYAVNKSAGGRTIGSATMPYTGVLLLAFIVFHLINFHFVDKTQTTIFDIVSQAFASPMYVGIYVIAMIVAAVHVSHGFWSAFQTVGANHPKYMPMIRTLSIVFALVVGFGFGILPIFVSISA
ncbi:succinate dehydrogenase cytochrome b subunit [Desulfatitalea tepidiphila]|uniref:succinate dehydrogenase cytochrome b subunit n=1 Tax=Desulfatitalea tepidiphila TaxID=1185843 RepID=UPI0006B40716|nr:succinate dehydrogenase cytochrome b subunit [Desulfatitalea tepidiphila]